MSTQLLQQARVLDIDEQIELVPSVREKDCAKAGSPFAR